ncbi:MAG: GNAT family N-acetyltransferase [bacterium]
MNKAVDVIKKIRSKFRYGLVLLFIKSSIIKALGVDIIIYHWVREGLSKDDFPELKDGLQGYSFEFLGPGDMKIIGNIKGRGDENEQKLLEHLKKGRKCLGAKYKGQVAAFTWIDLHGDSCRDHKLVLKENEAYLYDMYTLKPFRGKNIAPYLRHQCYVKLWEMGRDVFYSSTDVLNNPSIKFKRKLKARILALYFNIKLFKKYHFNWKVKEYRK